MVAKRPRPKRNQKQRTGKSTTLAADTAERQRQALEMRKLGKPYDVIAAALGFHDRSGAYRAVSTALAAITKEPAEEVRVLELERLDKLWEKAMAMVDGQEVVTIDGAKVRLDAIRTALKIKERRAKLLGLDAPTRVELTPPSKMTDEELRSELERELAKLKGVA